MILQVHVPFVRTVRCQLFPRSTLSTENDKGEGCIEGRRCLGKTVEDILSHRWEPNAVYAFKF